MPTKVPTVVAVVSTFVIALIISLVLFFGQIVLLNGVSERQASIALAISLGCQGVTLILAALLASRLTKTFIERFKWNNILSVIAAVIAATTLGALAAFLAIIVSIPLAGIS